MRKISQLKVEIVRKGLYQGDVAQEANMSESRLSRILNGRIQPRNCELKKIAQVLGLQNSDDIEKPIRASWQT
jgi:transcriptional regulator with XRE-family HTH domain